jgi:hypothetical protein
VVERVCEKTGGAGAFAGVGDGVEIERAGTLGNAGGLSGVLHGAGWASALICVLISYVCKTTAFLDVNLYVISGRTVAGAGNRVYISACRASCPAVIGEKVHEEGVHAKRGAVVGVLRLRHCAIRPANYGIGAGRPYHVADVAGRTCLHAFLCRKVPVIAIRAFENAGLSGGVREVGD